MENYYTSKFSPFRFVLISAGCGAFEKVRINPVTSYLEAVTQIVKKGYKKERVSAVLTASANAYL